MRECGNKESRGGDEDLDKMSVLERKDVGLCVGESEK